MSGIVRTIVAAVVAAGLPASVAWAEDRALIVGVGEYLNAGRSLNTGSRSIRFGNLGGNALNVELMQGVAGHLGFEDHQIRVLVDQQATYHGIKRGFEWLIDGVGPGDRALFYFSGHGFQVADKDGDEPDGKDEMLLPHDAGGATRDLTENVLVDDEMAVLLDRLQTRDVLVFLDSCHSGTAMRSFSRGGLPFFEGDAAGVRRPDGPAGTGFLALSAARDSEQALGTREGAFFTRGVDLAVQQAVRSDAYLTMNTIRDVASAEIERLHNESGTEKPIHHPVLTGDLPRAHADLRRRGTERPWNPLVVPAGAPVSIVMTGLRRAYRPGDRMEFEIEMPVDGWLHVLTIREGTDEATSLFPSPLSRPDTWFERRERVRIPDSSAGDRFNLRVAFETPNVNEERNLLVLIVSDAQLDFRYPSTAELLREIRRAESAATVEYLVRR